MLFFFAKAAAWLLLFSNRPRSSDLTALASLQLRLALNKVLMLGIEVFFFSTQKLFFLPGR